MFQDAEGGKPMGGDDVGDLIETAGAKQEGEEIEFMPIKGFVAFPAQRNHAQGVIASPS